MHMLPRGSQRQKRWRSHPPLPRKKKKEARPRGSSRSKRGMTKPTPIQRMGPTKHVQSFLNTCMCYEGWDCNLERKFVGIIKLLDCFIFQLRVWTLSSVEETQRRALLERFLWM